MKGKSHQFMAAWAVARLARRELERGCDRDGTTLLPGWVPSGNDRPFPIQPYLIQRSLLLFDIAVEIDPKGMFHSDRIQALELLSDFSGAIEAIDYAAVCGAKDATQLMGWKPKMEQKRAGLYDPRPKMRQVAAEFADVLRRHPELAAAAESEVLAFDQGAVPLPRFVDRPGSRWSTFEPPSEKGPTELGDLALDSAEAFADCLIEGREDEAHDMLGDWARPRWSASRLRSWFRDRFFSAGKGPLPFPTVPSLARSRIVDAFGADTPATSDGYVTVVLDAGGRTVEMRVLVTARRVGVEIAMFEWC